MSRAFSPCFLGIVCLACHTSFTPDAVEWHDTKHAYFIRKPMGAVTLKGGKGVMANSLGGTKDDFMLGLDFNTKTGTPFDGLKPNAPILSYDSSADRYMIQLGPTGLKLVVAATLGGSDVGNGQRYMVRVPVSDSGTGYSAAIYFAPVTWDGKAWTGNLAAWYNGSTPIYQAGGASTALANATMQGQNYLKNCAGCHITGVRKASITKAGEYVVNPYPAVLYLDDNPNYPDLDGDGIADIANIGCESCHGPGSYHIMNPSDKTRIVNPAKITDNVQRSNVCLQCHVQIASAPNKTWGFPYDEVNNQPFVLTNPVQSLDKYQVFTGAKYPDGWNYVAARVDSYRESPHYKIAAMACNDCHDAHAETKNPGQVRDVIKDFTGLLIPASTETDSFCLACHAGSGPFAGMTKQMVKDWNSNFTSNIRPKIEAHTHHFYAADRIMGVSNCITCHMAPTAGHGTVEGVSHTFRVARPEDTIALAKGKFTGGNSYGATGNVNSCSSSCHRGKAIVWSDVPANPTPNDNKFDTPNELSLAKYLVKYFGPGGTWWNTKK